MSYAKAYSVMLEVAFMPAHMSVLYYTKPNVEETEVLKCSTESENPHLPAAGLGPGLIPVLCSMHIYPITAPSQFLFSFHSSPSKTWKLGLYNPARAEQENNPQIFHNKFRALQKQQNAFKNAFQLNYLVI